ncbi:MAG: STAS domain-containing protein [Candidatus Omnitrophica bacterium]|nr:STAS domain-containing protein [Candidatus Omnitrophota bacterium]
MAPHARAKEDVKVLRCKGDLNASVMVSIKNQVSKLMNRNRKHVLLDLSKTEHVDLAGLGILVERIKKVRAADGDIKLCNVQPQVSETFRLVGVSKLIESFKSEDEAIRSFKVA